MHQFILPGIRAPLDDLLRVNLANARECFELFGGGGVEVKGFSLVTRDRKAGLRSTDGITLQVKRNQSPRTITRNRFMMCPPVKA